ncbi:P63C domain-containing protein [Candidatus Gottesmanbacteria bacterium]|nr:P63C domain-containing protein [Candidatus Gottesmanbacteria bacterium]
MSAEQLNEKQAVPSRAAGGFARKEALTESERKEIAREAALARWQSPERTKKAIFGSPNRPLKIGGNIEIPCYVLEGGTRVLVKGGMLTALGMTVGGGRTLDSRGRAHEGDKLLQFAKTKALEDYISSDIIDRAQNPIKFKLPNGSIAHGYEASLLPDICSAVLEARENHTLSHRQIHIAKQCEILLRGFAKVGLIALVDEATGYQEIRDREALQKILEKYITDEWAKWTKTFPDEYYKELFRLKGLRYPHPGKNKPSFIGHWTNDIVYKRLAPAILAALKEKNPRLPTGNRARRHHQHLTRDYGHPGLKRHLDNVVFLMRACSNWQDFQKMLGKAAPRYGNTIPLDFPSSN